MYNRIIKSSIYLLVFLLPLFFLPFSFEAFEFNKQYLLFFLVSLAFFAWLAKMVLVDREIKFKRSPLDIFVLAFLFVAVLSAVFSVDKVSSLFGFYGRFSDGLIGTLSLGTLYFLITNNVGAKVEIQNPKIKNSGQRSEVKEEKDNNSSKDKNNQLLSIDGLLKAFVWSLFFVILFSYLSVFGIWPQINNLFLGKVLPPVTLQATFNSTAGSMEGLAVFLAAALLLLIGKTLISAKKFKKASRVADYFLAAAILILLAIIDFNPAWLMISLSLVLFLAVVLWKRIFKEDVNKLLLPILLVVFAVAFIFIDTLGFQKLILNYQLPREQVLGQGRSWQIAAKSAVENIKSVFLGTGIGTFHYDFAKFKPLKFNQTLFWEIRFDRAGSYISEILGTIGFLGLFSYFILVGMFLLISYLFLQQNRSGTPLLMALLTLLIGQFVFYQNTTLAFAFWLILGLSVVNWQKPIKEKVISFKDFPELSLVFSALLVVFGLVFLGMYFFAAKFYLADNYYLRAVIAGNAEKLEKAAALNPYQTQYKIVLAREYFNKVFIENQKPLDQRDQNALAIDVYRAITYAKGGQIGRNVIRGAVETSPNRVAAWETLGIIYRDIQGMATGALDWGIKSFEKAISLEPTNPVLHTELGKLYLSSGDSDRGKDEFNKAKQLKSDYIDASVQLALLYESQDNLGEAVRQMESLAAIYPFNVEILFQLGRFYFNNNQINEAILQFERIIAITPNHSNAHYSLGIAYQKQGRTQEAIKEFEKVLELNPGNQDIQSRLNILRGEQ